MITTPTGTPEEFTGPALMVLTGQIVAFDDGRIDEVIMGRDLLSNHLAACEVPVIGGTTQTATLFFYIAEAIKGLKMIQRTYRGAIGPFTKVVEMGDFQKGNHEHTFEQDKVPDGFLERGHYKSIVEYADDSDKVLIKYTSRFCIVKRQHFLDQQCACSLSEYNESDDKVEDDGIMDGGIETQESRDCSLLTRIFCWCS